MKAIEAYQCSDGAIFIDDRDAQSHQDDLLGQELDSLLKLFKLDITRNQEYKSLLQLMNNRQELLKSIEEIARIIRFSEDQE